LLIDFLVQENWQDLSSSGIGKLSRKIKITRILGMSRKGRAYLFICTGGSPAGCRLAAIKKKGGQDARVAALGRRHGWRGKYSNQ